MQVNVEFGTTGKENKVDTKSKMATGGSFWKHKHFYFLFLHVLEPLFVYFLSTFHGIFYRQAMMHISFAFALTGPGTNSFFWYFSSETDVC
jgi:hypothetical protein